MEDNYRYILENLKKHNLCTYYVLPLMRLSFRDFGGEENFKNSYLSHDMKKLYIKVLDSNFFKTSFHSWKLHITDTSEVYVELDIPLEFAPDIQLFSEGKYSEFSNDAKLLITTHSGLIWRKLIKGEVVPVTDARLLALEKNNQDLRAFWESVIGYDMPEDSELMSKPEESTYLTLN